jgi:hypothetical protein
MNTFVFALLCNFNRKAKKDEKHWKQKTKKMEILNFKP